MDTANQTCEQVVLFNVSFIIPALNEASMLPDLLDSITRLEQTDHARVHETIVINAASTDNTPELALARGCVVMNTQPGSVATSRNLGAAHATGNILAFIDADCELPTDWLSAIVSELLEEEKIVALGAKMAANQINSTWVERAWYELAHQPHTSEKVSDVDWLATFNLVVKKSAFDNVGGFNESLTAGEDVELGYRLSKIGTLRRLSTCEVIHHGESKSLREFYHREAWRARGSLGIFTKHWNNPREILSFLLPISIVVGWFAGLFLAIIYLALLYQGVSKIELIAYLALAIGPFPIILLTLLRKVKWYMLITCGILMSVYFFARLQGTLRPFQRMERC